MELPRVSKRVCLFAILVLLCFTVTVNLLLTVWIITSVRLNFKGINISDNYQNTSTEYHRQDWEVCLL